MSATHSQAHLPSLRYSRSIHGSFYSSQLATHCKATALPKWISLLHFSHSMNFNHVSHGILSLWWCSIWISEIGKSKAGRTAKPFRERLGAIVWPVRLAQLPAESVYDVRHVIAMRLLRMGISQWDFRNEISWPLEAVQDLNFKSDQLVRPGKAIGIESGTGPEH